MFAALGALSGFLAVALGAFGAHALKKRLSDEKRGTFEIGVRYQMYHALALLLVGTHALAGWLFVAGTVVFSGSLYALALGGPRKLGAVTPLGGLAFLGGWAALAWSALR